MGWVCSSWVEPCARPRGSIQSIKRERRLWTAGENSSSPSLPDRLLNPIPHPRGECLIVFSPSLSLFLFLSLSCPIFPLLWRWGGLGRLCHGHRPGVLARPNGMLRQCSHWNPGKWGAKTLQETVPLGRSVGCGTFPCRLCFQAVFH